MLPAVGDNPGYDCLPHSADSVSRFIYYLSVYLNYPGLCMQLTGSQVGLVEVACTIVGNVWGGGGARVWID